MTSNIIINLELFILKHIVDRYCAILVTVTFSLLYIELSFNVFIRYFSRFLAILCALRHTKGFNDPLELWNVKHAIKHCFNVFAEWYDVFNCFISPKNHEKAFNYFILIIKQYSNIRFTKYN